MFVKIDSEKLKQLREQRCWSQQQLADFASLSLRTIQRIEAKAVASQESVKCLAAVFEIPTHALLANEDPIESKPEIHTSAIQTQALVDASSDIQSDGKLALKKLYIGFALVFASHMFGFLGIFTALDDGKISSETFQLLKDSLSIVLAFSAIVLFVNDKRLRKKHGIGATPL